MEQVSEPPTSHSDCNPVRMVAGIYRTSVLIFVPFETGYFMSYFSRTINALMSDRLTAEFRLSARELGLLTRKAFVLVNALQIAALAWFVLPGKAALRRLVVSRRASPARIAMTSETEITP